MVSLAAFYLLCLFAVKFPDSTGFLNLEAAGGASVLAVSVSHGLSLLLPGIG
jgi:hypothetical protein